MEWRETTGEKDLREEEKGRREKGQLTKSPRRESSVTQKTMYVKGEKKEQETAKKTQARSIKEKNPLGEHEEAIRVGRSKCNGERRDNSMGKRTRAPSWERTETKQWQRQKRRKKG